MWILARIRVEEQATGDLGVFGGKLGPKLA
jgi:hypothetical protein